MRGSLAGPRLLLRRLREVMAEQIGAQARLDKIVVQIALNMVAEVCSVYVLHADGRLELYATEGLKHEAVHLTTMRKGEGLVGLIAASAEALALPDAQAHPAFSYKPETGEEIFQSFLGVPILRGGNTLGRAGRAEPGAAHLFGRGGRGAANDRHAAGRDDRRGRAAVACCPVPRCCASLSALKGIVRQRRRRARPRGAARAARGRRQDRRRERRCGSVASR